MTIESFAEITKRVIAREGFAGFLPTACYPGQHHVKTLVGLPTDADPEAAAMEWAAASLADGEEFLVAFRVDDSHFRVVRRAGGTTTAKTFPVNG